MEREVDMEDLTRFRKLNVFFFGNEQEKREFYLDCVCPYMKKEKQGQYYATREWNGGPNVEIVYEGQRIDKVEFKNIIDNYCREKNLFWTKGTLEKNLESYRKNQSNLLQMEKKNKIEICVENHLEIMEGSLDMDYYQRLFNSSEQVKLHFESKFLLQPLIEVALKKIADKKMMHLLVMKLFQITMSLYEHGEKYASMIYFSNIEGVFGVAKQYGKEKAFRTYFETEYQKYTMANFDELELPENLTKRFEEVWRKIYEKCVSVVEENKLSEEGFYELEEQEIQMKSNIQNLESEFHQAFRKDKHLHDIVTGKVHLTFRSVTNILYSIMPALNISFLEKNLCCYAIVRYIAEKYNTSWQEIMAERVVV